MRGRVLVYLSFKSELRDFPLVLGRKETSSLAKFIKHCCRYVGRALMSRQLLNEQVKTAKPCTDVYCSLTADTELTLHAAVSTIVLEESPRKKVRPEAAISGNSANMISLHKSRAFLPGCLARTPSPLNSGSCLIRPRHEREDGADLYPPWDRKVLGK